MREQRLEKKFVYNQGDESYKYFLISGMFNEAYPKRIIKFILIPIRIKMSGIILMVSVIEKK